MTDKKKKGNTKKIVRKKVKEDSDKKVVKKKIAKKEIKEDENEITSKKEKLYKIPIDELINYRITKTGKVWSMISKKYMKANIINGYYRTKTSKENYAIHQLMAKTFVANPDNKPYVNHINENKEDNRAINLEWVTQKENTERHSKVISHSRQVNKIDVNTKKVIKTFEQITDAAKDIGLTRRSIQLVLNGQNKTAGGYYWKYVDQDNYKDDDIDFTMFKHVYDYDNYIVSSDGRIYNKTTKRFLKPVTNSAGRTYVTLCRDRKKSNCYIQRLVADHFLSNKPYDDAAVEHISSDKTDNRVENLKWSSARQAGIITRPVFLKPANSNTKKLDDNLDDDEEDKKKHIKVKKKKSVVNKATNTKKTKRIVKKSN